MRNSATRNMIGEEIIQFFFMMDASLLFKAFVMFLNQDTISSLLEPYMEKGFNFSSEGDLIEVSKDTHVKFQAERVGNIYILLKFEGYSWWIAIIFSFKIGGYGTIEDCDGFEFGCSILS